jgi:hypothetical protein
VAGAGGGRHGSHRLNACATGENLCHWLETFGEDVQAVAFGDQAVLLAEAVAEGDEFWRVDDDELSCVEADDEVGGGFAVGDLEVTLFFGDEDALDDVGVHEQAEGTVEGGFADAEARVAHVFECLLGDERPIETQDGVQHLGAFRGVLEAFGFEFAAEDGAEGLDDLEGFGEISWLGCVCGGCCLRRWHVGVPVIVRKVASVL